MERETLLPRDNRTIRPRMFGIFIYSPGSLPNEKALFLSYESVPGFKFVRVYADFRSLYYSHRLTNSRSSTKL